MPALRPGHSQEKGGNGRKMFLDKLWMRIKGELLNWQDDMSAGDDLRDKAAILLDKLERKLGSSEIAVPSDYQESLRTAQRNGEAIQETSLAEIEQEWQELMRQKEEKKTATDEPEELPPNPRTLG